MRRGIRVKRVVRGPIGFALGLALALGIARGVPAAAGPTPAPSVERPIRTIALVVNGTVVQTDTPPRVEEGRLLVPLRVVLDALGLNVSRAGSAISIRLPSGSVALVVGSNHVTVDGKDYALDAAVGDYDGSTYAPLQLLKVALGASARYDQHDAKVTIVSALIGRAAGAEEQRSDGGTMVNGTIAAIDANSIPPALTVTLGPQARTISINSDARISVEDVTVHSQLKAVLGDLRVGDRVAVRLAKDGRVIDIADFYSSDSGTLSAVSPAAIVLQNGKVVQPGKTSDITLNGAGAGLGDLHVGDFVTVRRNPETGEIRQIIAARTISVAPTQQPAAPNVVIKSFAISATRALRAGESFDVVLEGTPGGHASFDIGDYVADLPLRETAPGTYRASFTIPDRFNVTQVPVYGRLSFGGGIAPRAEASSTLSAATIPPQIPEVAPLPGESVNNVRPSIYATFVAPSAVAVNASSVTLSVNGHDVTSSATRTASFITYRPGVDLPRGVVEVTVKVADAAGNTASRSWTFTIGSK
jgi:hypothetical protein